MSIHMWSMSFASVVTVLALLFGSAPAHAQGTAMSVTITDKPDPAAPGGNVTYTIKAKNTWNKQATLVEVTIPIPGGTQFVSCVTSPKRTCAPSGSTIKVAVGNLGAGSQIVITLVLKMPSTTGSVTLTASADGSNVGPGSGQQTTTVASGGGGDPRGKLVVTATDSPDPAPAGGQVTYAFQIKNDSTTGATNVVVTIPQPIDVQFVKCAVSPKTVPGTVRTCTASASVGGTVTAILGNMAAHSTAKISLVDVMPTVTTSTTRSLTAKANGSGVTDGSGTAVTTILASGAPVVFQPSGRTSTVNCGSTVAFQNGETSVQFQGGLGCASLSGKAAVTINTPNVTVDLAGFKIVGGALPANIGNVGVRVTASGVTLDGGGTSGTMGIESFDFGVVENGGAGLTINLLRIFRARSVGIQTVSDGVALNGVLIDRTVAIANATTALPGGRGIHASGNITITNAIVRRSATLGIWIDGDATHVGVGGRVATITGSNSRVEDNLGIGIWADNGPHTLKDVHVTGDGIGGTSTYGVVINSTGTQVQLDGVAVQSFASWGIVDLGTGSQISRSSIDNTVSNGFAINGNGANLNGNESKAAGYGFFINGPGSVLTSNTASAGGDGFTVNGDGAILSSNNAVSNGGTGLVVTAANGTFATNLSQFNLHGFDISGSGHQFSNNQSKQNAGTGFLVTGTANTFSSNSAELNTGAEWNIGPNNVDGGANKANGSTFSFGAAGVIIN